ncbi:MAG: hypothetical protein AB7O26_19865 [Planctomycetaceae bacterium]
MARQTKNSRHHHDLERDSEAVMEGLHDVGRAARRVANDGVAQARDAAMEYVEQGKARVREASDSMQTHVQNEPMKSLLIAAAAGFFLGAIWTRR